METHLHAPGPVEEPLARLLLEDPTRLDTHFADPGGVAAVMPRLVTVSVTATVAHALALAVVGHQLDHHDILARTLELSQAYGLGFFGAQVAALPSAWFYALLAGIRQPAWRVAGEAMRAHATTSMVLLGLLPVWFAGALGATWLDQGHYLPLISMGAGALGLALPFLAGLAGTRALYGAFRRQVAERRRDPEAARSPAPLLLVLAWALLFTTMAPVGVAHFLGGL